MNRIMLILSQKKKKKGYSYSNIVNIVKHWGLNFFLIFSDFLRKAPSGAAKQNKDSQSSALPLCPPLLSSLQFW